MARKTDKDDPTTPPFAEAASEGFAGQGAGTEGDEPAAPSEEASPSPEIDVEGLEAVPLYARADCVCGDLTLKRGELAGVVLLQPGVPLDWFLEGFRRGKLTDIDPNT